jgi:hypothetical protein
MASFVVRFRSTPFNGTARLIAARDIVDVQPGSHFVVEIAQESVSEFKVDKEPGIQRVRPLSQEGDFHVRGVVCSVAHPSQPAGNRVTYVAVADAQFCLSLQDIGDLRPEVGTAVDFIVHDLSLWDEAI